MMFNRPCFPHLDQGFHSIVNMNTSLQFGLDFRSKKLLQEYGKLLDNGRFQAQAVYIGAARVRSNSSKTL